VRARTWRLRRLAVAGAAAAGLAQGASAQTVLEPGRVPDLWAVAAGAGRDAATGAWVPQVASAGRLPLAEWRWFSVGAVGEGAALVPLEGRAAGRVLGGLRMTVSAAGGSLWMGTSGGGASSLEGERPLWVAEGGGRWRWRRAGLQFSLRQTHAGGIPAVYGDSVVQGSDTIPDYTIPSMIRAAVPPRRYTDAELGMEFERGPLRLAAVAGGRLADRGRRAAGWVRAGADLRLDARTSLSVAAGRVAGAPELGSRGAPFVRFALRLTPPGRPPAAAPLVVLPAAEAGEAAAFEVRSAGERRTLRVRIPGAARVELKGDFTEWEPVELAAGEEPGTWQVTLPVAAGTYRLNVRVDGGEWIAPPGLLDVEDEFGGRVGLLVLG
jgi:hypothetical protein